MNLVKTSHQNSKEQEGASMVEYALLLLLIVVVAIVGVRAVGHTVSETFSTVNEQMTAE